MRFLRMTRALSAATAIALVAPVALMVGTSAPAAAVPPDNYSPPPGIRFSTPTNNRSHVIQKHILRSINSVAAYQKIRMVTWNLDSRKYVDALSRAHSRGVTVRVVMARGVALRQSDRGDYETLKRRLGKGNKVRPPERRSWIRLCRNSCRGQAGILHSKFFLFSRVTNRVGVAMSSSANLTAAAANNQWNDLVTVTDRPTVYEHYVKIFNQMAMDRPLRSPYSEVFVDGMSAWFHPSPRDNVPLRMLDQVRCTGAINGINGRTVIRVAQAVFNGNRGAAIARKLQSLHRAGCNVRIVFTVIARDPAPYLAGIPKRHIVQDFDGDGVYDRYLHEKSMAIHGNYAGDPEERVAYQGSSNWSGMGFLADEQGVVTRNPFIEMAIARRVDALFANPPRSKTLSPQVARAVAGGLIDPYAKVEFD